MTTQNPELLKMPLARDGDKTAIPETSGATTGDFSQQYGFQQINSLPLGAGGKAPKRNDFNGIFNLLSNINFYAQKGWTFHYDSTQDYYLGCLVIDPADGKRYECIADMPAGTVAPHADSNNDYWRRFTLGDGAHVGDIKAIAYNVEVQAGWLLCDGSAVSRTMYPDLFTAIGTTYGAGDGSTTFNLPNLSDGKFAEGSNTAGVVKQAGLPNIEGGMEIHYASTLAGATGALRSVQGTGRYNGAASSNGNNGISFDASLSNSIYGASDTVQPYSLTVRYIIKAFDGQTADSALIDITQYAQRLEEKADINGSNMVYHRDVITTSGTYTAPVTGLYKITVKGGGGGGAGGRSNASAVSGHGGGEGGTTIAYERMEIGDTATVVIGAGGTGGAASSTTTIYAGTDGGDSTVTVNSITYTGGKGYALGNGGTGTIAGASGGSGETNYSTTGASKTYGGAGGGAGGGTGGVSGNGDAGIKGGGGGGGCGAVSGAAGAGGAGGDGYVWFEFYTPGA